MKKKLVLFLIISVLLTSVLSSCGSNAHDAGGSSSKSEASVKVMSNASEDAKLIRTVEMSAETAEYDKFTDDLRAKVAQAGGYISYESSSTSSWSSFRSVRLTIRIPAAKLSEFTDGVRAACAVTQYTVETDDVTLDYVTLKAKADTLESEIAVVDDLYETLKTSAESAGSGFASGVITELQTLSARKTELYKELNTAKEQLDYYDNQVAYSTVELYLSEVEKVTEEEDKGFFRRAGDGFVSSLRAIGNGIVAFGVWFISALPYLVLIGGVGVGIYFLVRAITKVPAKQRAKKNGDDGSDDLRKTE